MNWIMAHGLVSLFCALALAAVVLHPRIHEGVLIKLGLIAIIFPCMVTFMLSVTDSKDWEAYWRAGFWTRSGLLAVCVGIIYKAQKARIRRHDEAMTRRWMRRMTDPVDDLAHFFNDSRDNVK